MNDAPDIPAAAVVALVDAAAKGKRDASAIAAMDAASPQAAATTTRRDCKTSENKKKGLRGKLRSLFKRGKRKPQKLGATASTSSAAAESSLATTTRLECSGDEEAPRTDQSSSLTHLDSSFETNNPTTTDSCSTNKSPTTALSSLLAELREGDSALLGEVMTHMDEQSSCVLEQHSILDQSSTLSTIVDHNSFAQLEVCTLDHSFASSGGHPPPPGLRTTTTRVIYKSASRGGGGGGASTAGAASCASIVTMDECGGGDGEEGTEVILHSTTMDAANTTTTDLAYASDVSFSNAFGDDAAEEGEVFLSFGASGLNPPAEADASGSGKSSPDPVVDLKRTDVSPKGSVASDVVAPLVSITTISPPQSRASPRPCEQSRTSPRPSVCQASNITPNSDSLTWVSHDEDCEISDSRPVREISFPTPSLPPSAAAAAAADDLPSQPMLALSDREALTPTTAIEGMKGNEHVREAIFATFDDNDQEVQLPPSPKHDKYAPSIGEGLESFADWPDSNTSQRVETLLQSLSSEEKKQEEDDLEEPLIVASSSSSFQKNTSPVAACHNKPRERSNSLPHVQVPSEGIYEIIRKASRASSIDRVSSTGIPAIQSTCSGSKSLLSKTSRDFSNSSAMRRRSFSCLQEYEESHLEGEISDGKDSLADLMDEEEESLLASSMSSNNNNHNHIPTRNRFAIPKWFPGARRTRSLRLPPLSVEEDSYTAVSGSYLSSQGASTRVSEYSAEDLTNEEEEDDDDSDEDSDDLLTEIKYNIQETVEELARESSTAMMKLLSNMKK